MTTKEMCNKLLEAIILTAELKTENRLLKEQNKMLMQLINKSNPICPNCKRKFTTTEVPSGIFCCYACEHGY